MDLGIISLVVSIAIGVPQIYLAWQQVRLSRHQATPRRTRRAENAPRPPSPPAATATEPTASPDPAQPPHAPTEPTLAESHQRHDQEAHRRLDPQPNPRLDPQVAESRPTPPPPDAPSEDAARGINPGLRDYIAPASLWIGGFVSLSALGWIFGYDDLAKEYTTPTERVQLSVSLWFMAAALLITSSSTGFTAYVWHREKAVNDDNEERFNLYVVMAVLGAPLALWLVIARRAVMF
ncbi:hypothetical protein [Nonomuraea sp. NPDC049129]|uniref:hypothetical protein n=1 Tax=Nonomuraea sp. NPDC049129 TaxID=3155272 RepID=UPI0033FFB1C3